MNVGSRCMAYYNGNGNKQEIMDTNSYQDQIKSRDLRHSMFLIGNASSRQPRKPSRPQGALRGFLPVSMYRTHAEDDLLRCQIPSLVSVFALGSNRFDTTLLTLEIFGEDGAGTIFFARWACNSRRRERDIPRDSLYPSTHRYWSVQSYIGGTYLHSIPPCISLYSLRTSPPAHLLALAM